MTKSQKKKAQRMRRLKTAPTWVQSVVAAKFATPQEQDAYERQRMGLDRPASPVRIIDPKDYVIR